MKTILFLVILSAISNALTVEDGTVAYGKLNTSTAAYIASIKALKKTQEKINKDLEKQIKMQQALIKATVHNVEKLKILKRVSSAYVDVAIAEQGNTDVKNEADIQYSKILNNKMTEDDIDILKKSY